PSDLYTLSLHDALPIYLSAVKPDPNFEISELVLHPGARINRFEEKAAFAKLASLDKFPTPAVPAADAIHKDNIIDLSSKMQPNRSEEHTSELQSPCNLV